MGNYETKSPFILGFSFTEENNANQNFSSFSSRSKKPNKLMSDVCRDFENQLEADDPSLKLLVLALQKFTMLLKWHSVQELHLLGACHSQTEGQLQYYVLFHPD